MNPLKTSKTQLKTAQEAAGAAVHVIDGASTDGTWERLLNASAGWNVRRQRGAGLASARNEALNSCRAPRIAFLDVDDVWHPEKLARQMLHLDNRTETAVVSCLLTKQGLGNEKHPPVPAWTPSGCLFRREAFDQVGLFDESYAIGCDHDWFVRARRSGLGMDLLPECLLIKHMHKAGLSRQTELYRREIFRILRSHG